MTFDKNNITNVDEKSINNEDSEKNVKNNWNNLGILFSAFLADYRIRVLTSIKTSLTFSNKKTLIFRFFPFIFTIPLFFISQPKVEKNESGFLPRFNFLDESLSAETLVGQTSLTAVELNAFIDRFADVLKHQNSQFGVSQAFYLLRENIIMITNDHLVKDKFFSIAEFFDCHLYPLYYEFFEKEYFKENREIKFYLHNSNNLEVASFDENNLFIKSFDKLVSIKDYLSIIKTFLIYDLDFRCAKKDTSFEWFLFDKLNELEQTQTATTYIEEGLDKHVSFHSSFSTEKERTAQSDKKERLLKKKNVDSFFFKNLRTVLHKDLFDEDTDFNDFIFFTKKEKSNIKTRNSDDLLDKKIGGNYSSIYIEENGFDWDDTLKEDFLLTTTLDKNLQKFIFSKKTNNTLSKQQFYHQKVFDIDELPLNLESYSLNRKKVDLTREALIDYRIYKRFYKKGLLFSLLSLLKEETKNHQDDFFLNSRNRQEYIDQIKLFSPFTTNTSRRFQTLLSDLCKPDQHLTQYNGIETSDFDGISLLDDDDKKAFWDFSDSLQTYIYNLDSFRSLEKSNLIPKRSKSGYKNPDMEIAKTEINKKEINLYDLKRDKKFIENDLKGIDKTKNKKPFPLALDKDLVVVFFAAILSFPLYTTKIFFVLYSYRYYKIYILKPLRLAKFLTFRYFQRKVKKRLKKEPSTSVLIKNLEKKNSLKDLIGIDKILPKVCEMVYILESFRSNKIKKSEIFPKGYLLVGPPGTGKTFLVKAIAGQAKVPVLIESGSSLLGRKAKGSERLEATFKKAKRMAPSILFIDEIDTIGKSRANLQPFFTNTLIDCFYNKYSSSLSSERRELKINQAMDQGFLEKNNNNIVETDQKRILTEKQQGEMSKFSEIQEQLKYKKYNSGAQLNVLVQLLFEMDRLPRNSGVIVIGATNRVQVLDPALARAGRFNTLLNLQLPGKKKRIEILKLYSKNAEKTKKISSEGSFSNLSFISGKTSFGQKTTKKKDLDFDWNYLGDLTFCFNAADLAAIINHSSLKAILQNTSHTIETIQQGIEFVTSYSVEKTKDQKYIKSSAYYQAGKAVLHTLLPQHPDVGTLRILARPKNSRHKRDNQSIKLFDSRVILETRLIGLYAGKAAELLSLSYNSHTKKQKKNIKKNNITPQKKSPCFTFFSLEKKVSVGCASLLAFPLLFSSQEKKNIEFFYTFFLQKKVQERKINKTYQANRNQLKKKAKTVSPYSKSVFYQTSIGIEDLSGASHIAHSLINKYHFYSNNILIERENQILTNQTSFEIKPLDLFYLLKQKADNIKQLVSGTSLSGSNENKYFKNTCQPLFYTSLWQNQIIKDVSGYYKLDNKGFRIFLPDLRKTQSNVRLAVSDKYYHDCAVKKNHLNDFFKSNNCCAVKKNHQDDFFKNNHDHLFLKNLLEIKKSKSKTNILPTLFTFKNFTDCQKGFFISQLEEKGHTNLLPKIFGKQYDRQIKKEWNDLYKIDRDYIYHALIYTSFNKAFCLLDENRELLDYLVDYLMRFQILQQDMIKETLFCFGLCLDSKKKEKQAF